MPWERLGQVPEMWQAGQREDCEPGLAPHQDHCTDWAQLLPVPTPNLPLFLLAESQTSCTPAQQGAPKAPAPPLWVLKLHFWSLVPSVPGPCENQRRGGVKRTNPSRRSWSCPPSPAAPQLASSWEPEARKKEVLILRKKTWALLVLSSCSLFCWGSQVCSWGEESPRRG